MDATNFLRTTFLVFDEADRMFDMGFGMLSFQNAEKKYELVEFSPRNFLNKASVSPHFCFRSFYISGLCEKHWSQCYSWLSFATPLHIGQHRCGMSGILVDAPTNFPQNKWFNRITWRIGRILNHCDQRVMTIPTILVKWGEACISRDYAQKNSPLKWAVLLVNG